jgi:4-oxalomesaconate tautomerase
MNSGVRAMWMRGGTSKGGYFLATDLPTDRDKFLLGVMGSPDPRQIDGMGGADPLTSKVAIVSPSARDGVDVDYLFLQVSVDQSLVSDAQPCGNILAGVGPFAIERGLVTACDGITPVTIWMENTGKTVTATVSTPGARVSYEGEAHIDGVPGTAAPVTLTFRDLAGSTCGAMLPTGKAKDVVNETEITCIDNGMPIIALRAMDFGLTGLETRAELDQMEALKSRLEMIRLIAGPLMGLGDVTKKTVPKMTLLSPPRTGGIIATQSFIPHRAHASIGVFAAISAATACMTPDTVAHGMAAKPPTTGSIYVEHPSGSVPVVIEQHGQDICGAGMVLTARKLFDGEIFVP